MAAIFVSKTDPFDFIEAEVMDEPIPDPGTETVEGVPGKTLDVRYRRHRTLEPWNYTTVGILKRSYAPRSGVDAKELVSPSSDEKLPEPPAPSFTPVEEVVPEEVPVGEPPEEVPPETPAEPKWQWPKIKQPSEIIRDFVSKLEQDPEPEEESTEPEQKEE